MTTHRPTQDDPFTMVLEPVPEAVGQARDLVGTVFAGWGLDADTARLIVSELATNAVRVCAPDQYVVVRAHLTGSVPTIEVWDCSDETPVAGDPGLTDESGRGLLLVGLLSSRWGVRPRTEGGKVVWAELPGDPGTAAPARP
ncbi:ATP-binding protein [Actinomadura scrupuli]|uniref:ATP-binding protein n=1 Tax=Actinomadura scrupuli TaxID=559629 RepID=UPI003D992683